MTKVLSVTVPDDFVLPLSFPVSDPALTARLLHVASLLPPFLLRSSGEREEEEGAERQAERQAERVVSLLRASGKEREKELESLLLAEKGKVASLSSEAQQLRREASSAKERAEGEARAVAEREGREERKAERAKIEALEKELRERLVQQCEATERHRQEGLSLRQRVSELETPTSLGRTAEEDVASFLRDAGLAVEDTSTGERKQQGYLDLLVQPEGREGEGLRLAIEVKNKHPVQKVDLDEFARKAADLVVGDRADAALFLSLRSHTKKGGPVVTEMAPDATGRPLVPFAWVGTEKAKAASPLTREQVETAVLLHLSLLHNCREIRKGLSSSGAGDVAPVQTLVSSLAEGFASSFSDLSKQQRLLDEMRENLTCVRARCIRMFHSLWKTDREVAWLGGASASPPWMDCYLTALSQDGVAKESDTWNRFSRQKGVVERSVGKDALFLAARTEGAAARAEKRKRDEGEPA